MVLVIAPYVFAASVTVNKNLNKPITLMNQNQSIISIMIQEEHQLNIPDYLIRIIKVDKKLCHFILFIMMTSIKSS